MSKIIAAVTAAAGYVLGTRAGREQYVQIKAKAQQLWNDPRVQEKKTQATSKIKATASQARERVQGQGSAAAQHTTDTATGAGGVQSVPSSSHPDVAPLVVDERMGPTP